MRAEHSCPQVQQGLQTKVTWSATIKLHVGALVLLGRGALGGGGSLSLVKQQLEEMHGMRELLTNCLCTYNPAHYISVKH